MEFKLTVTDATAVLFAAVGKVDIVFDYSQLQQYVVFVVNAPRVRVTHRQLSVVELEFEVVARFDANCPLSYQAFYSQHPFSDVPSNDYSLIDALTKISTIDDRLLLSRRLK